MNVGINLFLFSIPLGPQILPLVPFQLLKLEFKTLKLESCGEIVTLKAVLHAQISSKRNLHW